jgi:MSHA biogenesis protein MshE
MVGEMRDKETAEIGLRGALTGHLVLSTLHTNDAISSAIRLIDMGAPGYLVASSLRAVVAQRLVRKVCANCVSEQQPTSEELLWLNNIDSTLSGVKFKHGTGCQNCNNTGYRGRVGVFELLEMTESMMNALKANDTVKFAQAANESPGFSSLAKVALTYAKMGITTVDEVLKLIEMVADDKTSPSSEIAAEDLPELESGPASMSSLEPSLSLSENAEKSPFTLELEPQDAPPKGS